MERGYVRVAAVTNVGHYQNVQVLRTCLLARPEDESLRSTCPVDSASRCVGGCCYSIRAVDI